MEISPGLLLNNRYQIVHKLGQGGMGSVYLGRDNTLEVDVALKINLNPLDKKGERFLREARLLARLRHPNLPRVMDHFLYEDAQILVMDYVPGEDLGTVLAQEGPQPLEKVLRWATQLGDALCYLHGQKPPVIHRDIKPENIRLSAEGDAMLVDFGIAKVEDTSRQLSATSSGFTPGYAPLEQISSGKVGPFSDQFALAATLYHLITGKKPPTSVDRALRRATLEPIIQVSGEPIPPFLQATIEKGLALRPEERFSTSEAFLSALKGEEKVIGAIPLDSAEGNKEEAETVADGLQAVKPPEAQPTPTKEPVKKGSFPWIKLGIAAVVVVFLMAIFMGVAGLIFRGINPARGVALPTKTLIAVKDTSTLGQVIPPSTTLPQVSTERILASQTATASANTASPVVSMTNTIQAEISETMLAGIIEEQTLTLTPTEVNTLSRLGDGGLVAFSSDREDGHTLQIWTMALEMGDDGQIKAKDFKQVTSGVGDKTQPAWSPDGTRLAFVAPNLVPEEKKLGLDVWMINNDGTNLVNLSQRKGDDTDPSWSPDGKWIAFTNNGREDKVRQIYLMDTEGANQQRISYDLDESQPVWSPEGNLLLFVVSARDHHYLKMRRNDKTTQFNLATQTPFPYDLGEIFGRLGEVAHPAFSFDGEWIAYTQEKGNQKRIGTVRYKSRGADNRLLTDSGRDFDPAWSPDSNWLLYTSLRDSNPEIYIMAANGSLQTNLTQSPRRDLQPAWQP